MLAEAGSLFYRPKDKKMHADKAKQNFYRTGGDMFMLLNIWEQWSETNYSQSCVSPIRDQFHSLIYSRWCYENYVQFKTLSRVRDVRDQLAGLCERVEIVPEANANSNDITPIQKALVAGLFHCSVCSSFYSLSVLDIWFDLRSERLSSKRVVIHIEQPRATRPSISIHPPAYSTINLRYGPWSTMN